MNINTKPTFFGKKLGFEGVLGVDIFDITLKCVELFFSILAHLSVCPLKCVEIFSPKSMGFLKEIVVFLQNRPPSAGGPLKCVDFFSQNRILAHLSVCPLKCVGTVFSSSNLSWFEAPGV